MKPPKEISDIHVTQAMKRYGGSFVMALGQAAQHADTENLQIIKRSFPVIWEAYSQMAKQDLIEFVAAELRRANFIGTDAPLPEALLECTGEKIVPWRHNTERTDRRGGGSVA
jgi:hypothetical protein